jgi:hypothetical protein
MHDGPLGKNVAKMDNCCYSRGLSLATSYAEGDCVDILWLRAVELVVSLLDLDVCGIYRDTIASSTMSVLRLVKSKDADFPPPLFQSAKSRY